MAEATINVAELRATKPREFDATVWMHVYKCGCARCYEPAVMVEDSLPFCSKDCAEHIGQYGTEDAMADMPEFATCAGDDYATLKLVRETWDFTRRDSFQEALADVHFARGGSNAADTDYMAVVYE